ISGHFVHNFQNIYDEMAALKAAIILNEAFETTPQAIAIEVAGLLSNQIKCKQLTKAADKFAKSGNKSLGKIASALLPLIGGAA
ncbi:MAG: hypothetical protein FD128_2256, partial [Hyphomonadaceae bacterium]